MRNLKLTALAPRPPILGALSLRAKHPSVKQLGYALTSPRIGGLKGAMQSLLAPFKRPLRLLCNRFNVISNCLSIMPSHLRVTSDRLKVISKRSSLMRVCLSVSKLRLWGISKHVSVISSRLSNISKPFGIGF